MILISLAATTAVLMRACGATHPAGSDGARCEPQGWIAAASDAGVVTS
jgi:hypothetical protein